MFSRTIISGNEVAALKQCEENALMRETSSTKFSSTFEKSNKMGKSKNGDKLGGVDKYIVKMNDF